VIARAGEALFSLLETVLDGTYVARADIEAAAATYLVYYRNHIATEETAIMARAASVLTAADWDAVAAAVPQAGLRDAARAARALGA
jgi:hemerythrin-like domain-containing protein